MGNRGAGKQVRCSPGLVPKAAEALGGLGMKRDAVEGERLVPQPHQVESGRATVKHKLGITVRKTDHVLDPANDLCGSKWSTLVRFMGGRGRG